MAIAGLAQTMAGTLRVPAGGASAGAVHQVVGAPRERFGTGFPGGHSLGTLTPYTAQVDGHALNYASNAPNPHDVVVRWADRMIPR